MLVLQWRGCIFFWVMPHAWRCLRVTVGKKNLMQLCRSWYLHCRAQFFSAVNYSPAQLAFGWGMALDWKVASTSASMFKKHKVQQRKGKWNANWPWVYGKRRLFWMLKQLGSTNVMKCESLDKINVVHDDANARGPLSKHGSRSVRVHLPRFVGFSGRSKES